jgi:hypothetical protein
LLQKAIIKSHRLEFVNQELKVKRMIYLLKQNKNSLNSQSKLN